MTGATLSLITLIQVYHLSYPYHLSHFPIGASVHVQIFKESSGHHIAMSLPKMMLYFLQNY